MSLLLLWGGRGAVEEMKESAVVTKVGPREPPSWKGRKEEEVIMMCGHIRR